MIFTRKIDKENAKLQKLMIDAIQMLFNNLKTMNTRITKLEKDDEDEIINESYGGTK
tara:strand:- start:123 stop:293 length:171 start_codon:yes stop_codon:yes gene_type:complete